MSDYQRVDEALKAGADPVMLCATCPWDRHCITPPEMTSQDIEARIDEAGRKFGEDKGAVSQLMTALVFGGRDSMARLCPVFRVRLQTPAGETIARSLKTQMQHWDDNAYPVETTR